MKQGTQIAQRPIYSVWDRRNVFTTMNLHVRKQALLSQLCLETLIYKDIAVEDNDLLPVNAACVLVDACEDVKNTSVI